MKLVDPNGWLRGLALPFGVGVLILVDFGCDSDESAPVTASTGGAAGGVSLGSFMGLPPSFSKQYEPEESNTSPHQVKMQVNTPGQMPHEGDLSGRECD